MVVVKVFYTGERAVGFQTEGHANFSIEHEDVCCAAVSAVTQTAVFGLKRHLAQEPPYEIADGFLSCELPEGLSEAEKDRAHIIFSTMEDGLAAMQEAYPRNVKLIVRRQ